jgi:DNA-binding NtrC family response regulator
LAKKTILVVDNDATALRILAETLQDNYEVLIASDGVNAAYIYERNVDRIAALVTDLNMPRLDGNALSEWVHHIRPKLPIIIMSGSLRKQLSEELKREPATRFVGKPFEPVRLEAILQDVLQRVAGEAM